MFYLAYLFLFVVEIVLFIYVTYRESISWRCTKFCCWWRSTRVIEAYAFISVVAKELMRPGNMSTLRPVDPVFSLLFLFPIFTNVRQIIIVSRLFNIKKSVKQMSCLHWNS